MKQNITQALVDEHRLILRMLAVLERRAELTACGRYGNYRFYIEAADFIRSYADRFHHAKEEDILFAALIANGMPRDNSPVAAMLIEHDQGRAYVRAMEEAALAALAGKRDQDCRIAEAARGYVALLRDHIGKEDGILYPLAERVMGEEQREKVVAGYRAAGERAAAGLEEHYEKMVAAYEAEPLDHAA